MAMTSQQVAAGMLGSPAVLQRAIHDQVAAKMVGGRMLSNRVDATGTGSALIIDLELPDDDPSIIAELSEYPLTSTDATTSVAKTVKTGYATEFSDELVARGRVDVIKNKIAALSLQLIRTADARALGVVASAVTATYTQSAAWTAAGADPVADILGAAAQIEAQGLYSPDTVVVTPALWAKLVRAASAMTTTDLAGKTDPVIGGLRILKSAHIPAGMNGWVLDSKNLGAIVFEDLGGGYQGNPASDTGVETKPIRLDTQDGWRLQARQVTVPTVSTPSAAVRLIAA